MHPSITYEFHLQMVNVNPGVKPNGKLRWPHLPELNISFPKTPKALIAAPNTTIREILKLFADNYDPAFSDEQCFAYLAQLIGAPVWARSDGSWTTDRDSYSEDEDEDDEEEAEETDEDEAEEQ